MMQRSLLPTPGSSSSSSSRSRCCQHPPASSCSSSKRPYLPGRRQLCRPLASSSSSGDTGSSNEPLQPPPPPQQQTQQQQQQQASSEPWSLMGRVVRSDRLVLGAAPRQRLAILAASRTLDISPADMEQRLMELVTLLPDVASLLPSLNPTTLAGLARDTQAVASKLIALRLLFPAADVSQMISRRPTLLLDEEFSQVEIARTKLLARLARTSAAAAGRASPSASPSAAPAAGSNPNLLGTTGTPQSSSGSSSSGSSSGSGSSGTRPSSPVLDGLVSRQPLLLVAHVDELLDELERLLPAVDVMSALLRDPDLVTQVMCNRNLSIWLMPGVAVLQLLQNNPDCIYMVQRGTTALGPGAEFMGPG